MKLATEQSSSPDGRLLVVSRDLSQVADASHIAPTLQVALERWEAVEAELQSLYQQLNEGQCPAARSYDKVVFAAPLPRAWQWLDGSAFSTHGELLAKAFNQPPIDNRYPLMYQGLSHRFYGPREAIPFRNEEDSIDFEGEFGIITSQVAMGASASEAAGSIRLLIQLNDWSLRHFAPLEMKTGFGWILAKPACSVAPVAVTPDEFGDNWQDGYLKATLEVYRGDERFGAVPSDEMGESFIDLAVHAARTRDLCAGTIIGSGTVSHSQYQTLGSCCIAERRAIEMIDHGSAQTPYLQFSERIRMQARLADNEPPLFGVLDQQVVKA